MKGDLIFLWHQHLCIWTWAIHLFQGYDKNGSPCNCLTLGQQQNRPCRANKMWPPLALLRNMQKKGRIPYTATLPHDQIQSIIISGSLVPVTLLFLQENLNVVYHYLKVFYFAQKTFENSESMSSNWKHLKNIWRGIVKSNWMISTYTVKYFSKYCFIVKMFSCLSDHVYASYANGLITRS